MVKSLCKIGPIDEVERFLVLNARDGVSLRPYIRLALPPADVRTSDGREGLAVFDYAWQCWQFEKSLRMRKCDVEEENKSQEGGPQLKALYPRYDAGDGA